MNQCISAFVLLHLTLRISADYNYSACRKHEVMDLCGLPPSCQPSCSTPNPPMCSRLRCQVGCACKKGLLRDDRTNQCIPPRFCPQDCGKNEEWTPCGAACVQTCQNLANPTFCPSNRACTPGCICGKGFIRDEMTRKCIPRKNCCTGSSIDDSLAVTPSNELL